MRPTPSTSSTSAKLPTSVLEPAIGGGGLDMGFKGRPSGELHRRAVLSRARPDPLLLEGGAEQGAGSLVRARGGRLVVGGALWHREPMIGAVEDLRLAAT